MLIKYKISQVSFLKSKVLLFPGECFVKKMKIEVLMVWIFSINMEHKNMTDWIYVQQNTNSKCKLFVHASDSY